MPTYPSPDPGEWSGEQPAIHPSIARAFRALEASGLPWVLLRGEDDLVRPAGDVDILLGAGQSQRVDRLLAEAGFRRVLAPGHGSHRFYFSYDAAEDLWLKLDLVSEISFGPFQQWPTPLAEGCLKRRIRNGLLWLPATTEQAWLQLLHIMLDKGGAVRPDRMETVRVAGALASTDDVIASFVDRQVGPGTAAELLKLVRAGRFEDFREPGRRMAAALTRNAPLRTRLNAAGNRVLRLLGPRLPGRLRGGIVVGVTGPAGADKSALLHRLTENLPVPGRYVYLGGGAGDPGGGGPRRRDRRARRISGRRRGQAAVRQLLGALAARYHCLRGRVVVVDRPRSDTRPPASGRAARNRDRSVVVSALLPEPDLLLVLDPARSRALLLRDATEAVWEKLAGFPPPGTAPDQPHQQATEPGEQP